MPAPEDIHKVGSTTQSDDANEILSVEEGRPEACTDHVQASGHAAFWTRSIFARQVSGKASAT